MDSLKELLVLFSLPISKDFSQLGYLYLTPMLVLFGHEHSWDFPGSASGWQVY